MRYFSGFGFSGEKSLFSGIFAEYHIKDSPYSVCGFSYGAQKAISYALDTKNRVNELILLSPAFFNDKSADFGAIQLESFRKNKSVYMKYFYKNVGCDSAAKAFMAEANESDLEKLLNFRFKESDLSALKTRGVEILTILGECDKIIDSAKAAEFFRAFGVVILIKNANHILRGV